MINYDKKHFDLNIDKKLKFKKNKFQKKLKKIYLVKENNLYKIKERKKNINDKLKKKSKFSYLKWISEVLRNNFYLKSYNLVLFS